MKCRLSPIPFLLCACLFAAHIQAAPSSSKRSKPAAEESDAPAPKKKTGNAGEGSDSDSAPAKKSSPSKANAKAAAQEEEEAPKKSTSSKPKPEADETEAKPKAKSPGKKPAPEEAESPSGTPAKKAHGKGDVPEAAVEATPKETAPATPPLKPGGTGAPPAFIESSELKNFKVQPERVQKMIESALALSRQGLTYKYGSDDPANGGMDCSGSIAYLLREQGFKDVPRDASGQYAWARQAGKFFAVVSKKAGGFEFEDLQPGDLMFWSGTYAIDRDPPVTHSMIYLGEHASRKQRVMWGSSDGRTYDGKSRFGVGVFDFKMPKGTGEGEGNSAVGKSPDFLGYARIPGLREEPKLVKAAETETKEETKEAEPKRTESKRIESRHTGAESTEDKRGEADSSQSKNASPKTGKKPRRTSAN